MLPHLPALRLGQPYASLDRLQVTDCCTGESLASVSQVNSGVIRKDLRRLREGQSPFGDITCEKLIGICRGAAEHFLNGRLPLGDQGHTQTFDDYVRTLSATSGLPHVLVRRNSQKIASALHNMRAVLNGLTRGLDLAILDSGAGEQAGTRVSFFSLAPCLGLVMPSNSPGVNSLWLPAIPLKIPVLVKPGREEPWTPYRLIQAFVAAGCPTQAFGFYPTDHEGGAEILHSSGRALVFGDKTTTAPYANDPAIQVHGPGFSKILIGEDEVDRWAEFMDVIIASILENGGRSCINASAVIVPRHAAEIADAVAQRLGPVAPLPANDDQAKLSAFANAKTAESINALIEDGLRTPGAADVTAKYRDGSRMVMFEGAVYLRPTIVHCDSFTHPLANREFLFPYASVIEMDQSEMLAQIGPSLVVTAITGDQHFRESLLRCPMIDRLNLGPISTMQVTWDQPHEGNLFEFLYRRRALEIA
jgi:hypothetical protein